MNPLLAYIAYKAMLKSMFTPYTPKPKPAKED
jgi:hypothetical protein